MAQLNNTLLIANPAAHSGEGARAIEQVSGMLETSEKTSQLTTRVTSSPGDGERFARSSSHFDTVLALGGDGIIHEVANGLMSLSKRERPSLGIIALGSGNDFARTIKAPRNNPEKAVEALLAGSEHTLDLGRVWSDRSKRPTYFVETLSFGLDAAIALDTSERRAEHAVQRGSALFATSGFKIMSRVHGESSGYPSRVSLDGREPFKLNTVVFALQNGPTYGGGFKICPHASPEDGQLDACFNVRTPGVAATLAIFARARFGLHASSPIMELERFKSLDVTFTDAEPPCQADGEELEGSSFHVRIMPSALRVIIPPGSSRPSTS